MCGPFVLGNGAGLKIKISALDWGAGIISMSLDHIKCVARVENQNYDQNGWDHDWKHHAKKGIDTKKRRNKKLTQEGGNMEDNID